MLCYLHNEAYGFSEVHGFLTVNSVITLFDMVLQEVVYSYNEIEEIPDLFAHQALTKLILDG